MQAIACLALGRGALARGRVGDGEIGVPTKWGLGASEERFSTLRLRKNPSDLFNHATG